MGLFEKNEFVRLLEELTERMAGVRASCSTPSLPVGVGTFELRGANER